MIGRSRLPDTGRQVMRGLTLPVICFACAAVARGAPIADPVPGTIEKGESRIKLETVASGLTAPNYGTFAPGNSNQLYVTDQVGQVWRINLTTGEKFVFLDVSDRLVDLGVGGSGTFDERGLLGLAFHPNYMANGLLYTYTSEPSAGDADFSTLPPGTAPDHQSVISEWQAADPGNPQTTADNTSRRVLMRIDQPQFNHDGGTIAFGPDHRLYISLGDGGSADDQGEGHVTGGNGQNPANILGTIIRIDPGGTDSANGQYGIPPDNPFVDEADVLNEIFAFGLRNPYRFSFDSLTGQLWAGDAGQNDIEEVDIIAAGDNLGWNFKEGSFFFDPNGEESGFVSNTSRTGMPDNLVDPVAEYDHDEGTAVIGGFVYRGAGIPELSGKYIFGELAETSGGDGRLFYLENGAIREFKFVNREELGLWLLGFGRDSRGELYVMANETGVPFEDSGVVLKMVVNPTFDILNNQLHLPAVSVNRASAPPEVLQADLSIIPAGTPAQFQVGDLARLDDSFQVDDPVFDLQTGRLDIQTVDLLNSVDFPLSFSARLDLVDINGSTGFSMGSTEISQTSSLDIASGILRLPAVDLVGDSGLAAVRQVEMEQSQDTETLTFEVTSNAELPLFLADGNPVFEIESGILEIPVVEVIDATGNRTGFTARLSTEDGRNFSVIQADPIQ